MKWQSFKGWTLTLNDSKGWVQSVPCQLLLFLLETFLGFACLDLKRCGCCNYWWRCHLKGQLWDRSPGHWQTTVHVSLQKKKKNKTNFSQKQGVCLESPMATTARGCWEGEISTTVSKLLTPRQRGSRGRGAGASDRENLAWMAAFPSPRRKAGVEQPISQISWGNWLLSFWQSKQKGNAINTATLIWYTVYRGEGLIVYLSTGGYRLTLICNLHVYLFPPFPLSL